MQPMLMAPQAAQRAAASNYDTLAKHLLHIIPHNFRRRKDPAPTHVNYDIIAQQLQA
jgi:hypothetical protein